MLYGCIYICVDVVTFYFKVKLSIAGESIITRCSVWDVDNLDKEADIERSFAISVALSVTDSLE